MRCSVGNTIWTKTIVLVRLIEKVLRSMFIMETADQFGVIGFDALICCLGIDVPMMFKQIRKHYLH